MPRFEMLADNQYPDEHGTYTIDVAITLGEGDPQHIASIPFDRERANEPDGATYLHWTLWQYGWELDMDTLDACEAGDIGQVWPIPDQPLED